MTILYIVGRVTEELRYSLRSVAANLPHDHIALSGSLPRWATGIQHIQAYDSHRDRARNVTQKVLAGLEQISGPDVVLMWDDVMILQPWRCDGLHWAGTLMERLMILKRRGTRPTGLYYRYIRGTMLTHGRDAKSCGTNHPHLFAREKLMQTCRASLAAPLPWELASAYGAMHGGNFIRTGNAKKVKWARPTEKDYVLSTNDSWEGDPDYLAWRGEAFPEPCRYEA